MSLDDFILFLGLLYVVFSSHCRIVFYILLMLVNVACHSTSFIIFTASRRGIKILFGPARWLDEPSHARPRFSFVLFVFCFVFLGSLDALSYICARCRVSTYRFTLFNVMLSSRAPVKHLSISDKLDHRVVSLSSKIRKMNQRKLFIFWNLKQVTSTYERLQNFRFNCFLPTRFNNNHFLFLRYVSTE